MARIFNNKKHLHTQRQTIKIQEIKIDRTDDRN